MDSEIRENWVIEIFYKPYINLEEFQRSEEWEWMRTEIIRAVMRSGEVDTASSFTLDKWLEDFDLKLVKKDRI